MRIIRSAVLAACGVLLVGCTDAADQSLTEPLSASRDASPLVAISGSDRVTGTGFLRVVSTENRFNVAARSGPLGEDPRGHFRLDIPDGATANGPVRCLIVAGNRAIVGADRTDTPPGQGVYIVVQDNGNPGDEIPDMGNLAVGQLPDEVGCAFNFAFVQQLFPLEGNVTVRDALPAVP